MNVFKTFAFCIAIMATAITIVLVVLIKTVNASPIDDIKENALPVLTLPLAFVMVATGPYGAAANPCLRLTFEGKPVDLQTCAGRVLDGQSPEGPGN